MKTEHKKIIVGKIDNIYDTTFSDILGISDVKVSCMEDLTKGGEYIVAIFYKEGGIKKSVIPIESTTKEIGDEAVNYIEEIINKRGGFGRSNSELK